MKSYLLIASALIITGCSSAMKAPPILSEALLTDITEQGNKVFTYRISLNMSQLQQAGRGGRGGRMGGMGGGMGGMGGGMGGMGGGMGGMGGGMGGMGGMGGDPSKAMEKRKKMMANPEALTMERMEFILTENSYCSNGWFITESQFGTGTGEVKGECRASSGDE